MRAHQIMTRQVITVATGASIVDAANIMLDKHISGLPVVDKAGKLVGIVSQGELYPPRRDWNRTEIRSMAKVPGRPGQGSIRLRS